MTSSSSYGTSEITLQFNLSHSRLGLAGRAGRDRRRDRLAAGERAALSADLSSGQSGGHAGPGDRSDVRHDATLRDHRIRGDGAHPQAFASGGRRRSLSEGGRRAPCGCRSTRASSPRSACRSRMFAEPSTPPPSICRKGEIDGPRQMLRIGANDQLFDATAYRDAIIAYRSGAPSSSRTSAKPSTGLKTRNSRPGTTASRR